MTEKNISGLPPMGSFEEAFKNAFNDSLKRNTENIPSVQHDQKCIEKNEIEYHPADRECICEEYR